MNIFWKIFIKFLNWKFHNFSLITYFPRKNFEHYKSHSNSTCINRKYNLYQHNMCIIIFDTRGVKSWCWVKLNLSNQYSTNILLPKLELKRDLRKTLITIWRDYPTKTKIVRNSAFFVTFLSNLRGWKEKRLCRHFEWAWICWKLVIWNFEVNLVENHRRLCQRKMKKTSNYWIEGLLVIVNRRDEVESELMFLGLSSKPMPQH